MKTGYDQHFKKAQKIAFKSNHGTEARPLGNKRPRLQAKDSKSLAQELRQRAIQSKAPKKSGKKISWKMAGYSLIGLLIASLGLWKIEQIEKIVKNIEISVLGAAYAEETKVADSKPAEPAKAASKEEAPTKKEYTQDEINHFSKLNERKRELDAREEELNRMEQELSAQKAELDKRLTELETTRRNISSVLEEKVQADDKKVENLVQMYSNMKPQQAAKVFEEMDEGLAIEILGRMKKKNAAEIMSLVKAEKVKVLSEKYAGYKRN